MDVWMDSVVPLALAHHREAAWAALAADAAEADRLRRENEAKQKAEVEPNAPA